ncbi:MAG: hypothetical protein ACREVX_11415 [Clostridium sp.]|uniref:hypothetical protein n=1 Tax=Clostridium sp. TaxID=1506 RepID=UPI003D6CC3CB
MFICIVTYNILLNIKLEFINIEDNHLTRPEFHHLLSFLYTALENDTPIAFLNLDNGDEKGISIVI